MVYFPTYILVHPGRLSRHVPGETGSVRNLFFKTRLMENEFSGSLIKLQPAFHFGLFLLWVALSGAPQ